MQGDAFSHHALHIRLARQKKLSRIGTRVYHRVSGKIKAKIRRYKRLMAGEFDRTDTSNVLYK